MQFLYNTHSIALIIGIQKILQMPLLNINDNSKKCYKRPLNLNHTYYFFKDIKNIDLNLLNIRHMLKILKLKNTKNAKH